MDNFCKPLQVGGLCRFVKWVAREELSAQVGIKGMGNGLSEAHTPGLGCSGPLMHSPFSFEAGACSKHSQYKPSPVSTGPIVEDGKVESRSSDLSSISVGASDSMFLASSVLESLPPRSTAMAPMGDLGSSCSVSTPVVPSGSGSSV